MSVGIEYIRKLCKLMFTLNQGDHLNTLGMTFTEIEKGFVTMELPYSEGIVGNPQTGIVHGGAVTALLDTCCGIAAGTTLEEVGMCPTLDLRMDYMRAAAPNDTIYAQARVYRTTKSVIFCRGKAYQKDPERPVAYCVANFARLDPEVLRAMSEQLKPFLDAVES